MAIVTTLATAVAIGATAVAAVGVGASIYNAKKSRKAQKKAAAIDAKRGRLQAGRAAIGQVRQAQIARASVLQQGENQGAGDSTAIAGSTGAIQSQAGGNMAFAQQIFGLQNSANRLRQSAMDAQGRSAGLSQLANLGFQAAGSSAFTGGVAGMFQPDMSGAA